MIKHAVTSVFALVTPLLACNSVSAEERVYHKGSPWDVVLTVPENGGAEAPYCAVTSNSWASRSVSIELTLTAVDNMEIFVRLRKDGWNLPVGKETNITVGSYAPGATMIAKAIDSDHLYARLPPAPANTMDGNAMNLVMSLKTVWATRDAMRLFVQFPGSEQPWIVPSLESFEAYQFNEAYQQCKHALTQIGPSIYRGSESDSTTSPFDQSGPGEGASGSDKPTSTSPTDNASLGTWRFSFSEEDWGESCVAMAEGDGVKIGFMASPGKDLIGFVEGVFEGDVTAMWRVDTKISRVLEGGQSEYSGWHEFGGLSEEFLDAAENGQQLTIGTFIGKRISVGLDGAKQAISSLRQCVGHTTEITSASSSVADTKPDKLAKSCLLQVKGKKFIDGPCSWEANGGDTTDRVMTANGYFATLFIEVNGSAMAYWNEQQYAGHAHGELGKLKKDGNCWVNKTTRLCVNE